MGKTLSYRWFGTGKIPAAVASELNGEGVILLDEGIKGSVTYTNFHRPGKYSGWEKRGFTAAIALTQKRLLVLSGGSPAIDVPLTDDRLRAMQFSVEKEKYLRVVFDAGLFQPEWSGTIEYRIHTPSAEEFLQKLNERIA